MKRIKDIWEFNFQKLKRMFPEDFLCSAEEFFFHKSQILTSLEEELENRLNAYGELVIIKNNYPSLRVLVGYKKATFKTKISNENNKIIVSSKGELTFKDFLVHKKQIMKTEKHFKSVNQLLNLRGEQTLIVDADGIALHESDFLLEYYNLDGSDTSVEQAMEACELVSRERYKRENKIYVHKIKSLCIEVNSVNIGDNVLFINGDESMPLKGKAFSPNLKFY
jgi:hypothetical protein